MTSAETRKFFDALYDLRAAMGPKTSKHEIVKVLIWACIERGLNTRRRIAGAVHEIGFQKGHIVIVLQQETGSDPMRHWWWRDEEGRYSLHH